MNDALLYVAGALILALLAWWYWRAFYGRVDAAERCVLALLAKASEPMYGLDMVKQSGGQLGRGTVYVLLARLEERGLVASTCGEGELRRRYTLTRDGKNATADSCVPMTKEKP